MGKVYYLYCSQPPEGDQNILASLFRTCMVHFDIDSVFQMACISLQRALRSENNHGRHIEGAFQTKVLKTGHFKRPFGMKDFEGYNF